MTTPTPSARIASHHFPIGNVLRGPRWSWLRWRCLRRPPPTNESSRLRSPASTFLDGLGVTHVPIYEDADAYKTRALPMINYRSGRFFAGAIGGVGYNASMMEGFEFGSVMSYRFGRKESDSDRLHGLGDIDEGVDVGAFARWNLHPFFLHATLKQGVSGDV